MPIDLYYNRMSGPSRAVWMTARELNIDIKLKHLDLMAKEQMKPEFIKVCIFGVDFKFTTVLTEI